MKTRVVRYWHESQWLHKVESWACVTGDEQWTILPSSNTEKPDLVLDSPKKGEWYWRHEAGALSAENALRIARELSEAKNPDRTDVVAEFGEGE